MLSDISLSRNASPSVYQQQARKNVIIFLDVLFTSRTDFPTLVCARGKRHWLRARRQVRKQTLFVGWSSPHFQNKLNTCVTLSSVSLCTRKSVTGSVLADRPQRRPRLYSVLTVFSVFPERTKYLFAHCMSNVSLCMRKVSPAACYLTGRKVYENDICWLFSLMLEWTKYLYMTLRRNVTWQAFCVPYQTRRKVYENYIFLTVFFNTGMDYNTCVWHWESMQPDALSVCFIKQTRQQAWSTFAGCFLHFLKRLNTCLFVQCYFVHTESVTGCILSDGRKVILCHSLVVLFTSRTD